MLIAQTFTVPMPPDEALDLLTDLPRIAPCMPGATLTSSDGEIHHGRVKIKVGPIMLTYQGEAELGEVDRSLNTATLIARGTELKGSGRFGANIVMRLQEMTGSTQVHVDATLDITGRLAQFGRSAISDISGVLVGQFVANLTQLLNSDTELRGERGIADGNGPRTLNAPTGGSPADRASADGSTAPVAVAEPAPSHEPPTAPSVPLQERAPGAGDHIDLLAVGRGALLRRVHVPQAVAAVFSVAVLVFLIARRRGRARAHSAS